MSGSGGFAGRVGLYGLCGFASKALRSLGVTDYPEPSPTRQIDQSF